MIFEQLTGKMPSGYSAREFANHTKTFIPVIVKLPDGKYVVGKEVPALDKNNKYIFDVNKLQIVTDLSTLKDLRIMNHPPQRNNTDPNADLPIEQLRSERVETVKRFPAILRIKG